MTLSRRDVSVQLRRDEQMTAVTFHISGYGEVEIDVPGETDDEVHAVVLEWLAGDEWLTVNAVFNGARKRFTFRSAWVAGFTVAR